MGPQAVQRLKKEEFLEASFYYLVKHGLDNVSLRDLCKNTGISMGSVYYWFDGKEGIFIEAAEYGLRLIADKIFATVYEALEDFEKYVTEVHKRISGEEMQALRFIYQMTTSPIYGDRMREAAGYLSDVYDDYARKLAARMNCSFECIQPFVYIFIAEVLDYVVWGNLETSQRQMKAIVSMLKKACAEERSKQKTT